MRAADLLIRSLTTAGVERIFTLSGNQIMPVFDACIDQPVELIHVRHEAAAVHMADAYGRLTGEPGIALVTAGPGFANALSALYVAFMAESPLVLISGASPLNRRGMGAFQEMPQAEIAGHFTKASWEVTDPARLGHDFARAVRTAKSGRPGPVHLMVAGEVFEQTVEQPSRALPQAEDFRPLTSLLDATTAEAILAELSNAERPVILAGPSMIRWEAHLAFHNDFPDRKATLQVLAEELNVPVVAMESPRGLKDPSLGRFREVLAEADLVLLLARPLDFAVRFGESPAFREDCRFLVIDPEARIIERANRNLGDESRMVLTDLADPLPAVERLLHTCWTQECPSYGSTEWRERFESAVAARPSEWDDITSPDDGPLHPVLLCRVLHRFLADDDVAVFISDGGEFGQWAQACISAPHRVINGASGSIGGGIPFAFAARCAFPDSNIIATVGDGTFGFHAMEFDTAVRHNLPAVIVVGNDACWNAERQIQLRDYGAERQIGCELLPSRYDEVAKALGGHGEYVAKYSELEPALERAFDSGRPACVNVLIEGAAAPE